MNDSTPSTCRRADARAVFGDASAVFVAVAFPTLLVWIYFVVLPEQTASPAIQRTAYTLGKILQFAFPLVWVLAIQRCRLAWKKPDTKGVTEGLLVGVAIFAATLILYYAWLKPAGVLDVAREPIRLRLAGYGLTSLPMYVLFGVFIALAHSLLEEYYWRWFVFGRLRRLAPFPVAIAVSSVGFMAHHVVVLSTYFGWWSPEAVLFSLAVAVGGGVWAWIYHRSGSLYGVWVSHLLVDVVIFVVGYDLVGGHLS